MKKIEEHMQVTNYKVSEADLAMVKCLRQL